MHRTREARIILLFPGTHSITRCNYTIAFVCRLFSFIRKDAHDRKSGIRILGINALTKTYKCIHTFQIFCPN